VAAQNKLLGVLSRDTAAALASADKQLDLPLGSKHRRIFIAFPLGASCPNFWATEMTFAAPPTGSPCRLNEYGHSSRNRPDPRGLCWVKCDKSKKEPGARKGWKHGKIEICFSPPGAIQDASKEMKRPHI
jgi:hypothetical protein